MKMEKNNFRVIVAGGGVAGLTLANSLHKAHIPYVLLEARDEVAPLEGASIAISANGGRILDQIGALTDVYNASTPCLRLEGYKDGAHFESNDFPHLNAARFGYSLNFLERQSLLRILYQSVPNKKCILTGKRVSRIDHNQDGILVRCRDGTSYEGSVVVGADGVHSIVRQEMWRSMDVVRPGVISQEEIHRMTAEYSCIYGISKPVKGLSQGSLNKTYGDDVSFLTTVGKQNQVFWFVFQKFERKYTTPNIPKFTKQDAEDQVQKFLGRRITDEVVFQQIWEQRDTFTLQPLEEALFCKWTWGRFACIGDSAHKWTPNIGQGGNNAIEDAAALVNSLHKLLKNQVEDQLPSISEIAGSLAAFQTHRQARAEATYDISNKVTRIEALKGPMEKFLALYLFPSSGELLANRLATSMIGSEKLDFLPEPERSYCGTMAFNQTQGLGRHESLLKRAMWALPLLMMGFCYCTMLPAITQFPSVINVPWQDRYHRRMVSSPHSVLQNILFATNLGPICIIWLFESKRRANTFSSTRFAVLFGIASQRYGFGVIGPLYLFLHYIQSPLSIFAAFDQRLVNVAAARTALPALVLVYTLPLIGIYVTSDWPMRLIIDDTWQLFPVWLPIAHYILQKLCIKDTTSHDRIYEPFTDLPHIRFAIKAIAVASAVLFNIFRWQSLSALLMACLTSANGSDGFSARVKCLKSVYGIVPWLRTDLISCVLACFFWLALLFKDLKEAEMVRTSWVKLVTLMILTVCLCGPGAVIVLGWLWREELLASRRAKGAVVRKADSTWR